jgi:hypothetical protein
MPWHISLLAASTIKRLIHPLAKEINPSKGLMFTNWGSGFDTFGQISTAFCTQNRRGFLPDSVSELSSRRKVHIII